MIHHFKKFFLNNQDFEVSLWCTPVYNQNFNCVNYLHYGYGNMFAFSKSRKGKSTG